MRVALHRLDGDAAVALGEASTDGDGRVADLGDGALRPGRYRLSFAVGPYFGARGESAALFTDVHLDLEIADERHVHVPLLIAPNACVSYRGS